MIIVLSPAKNLDFETPITGVRATKPKLLDETMALSEVTAKLKAGDLKRLMGISDKLADLNVQRFQAFQGKNGSGKVKKRPAALAFNGDVYLGLDAKTLDADDLAFAQKHLRILSGLYGILRPLDGIEPYRLEMGTKLKTARGANLYDFWGSRIAEDINKALKGHGDKTIVNLASNEYFGAVDEHTLTSDVVTPTFKEIKDGKARQLMFFAKRARGTMARWIIRNRVDDVASIKDFDGDGYRFDPEGSTDSKWLFTRPQPKPKTG